MKRNPVASSSTTLSRKGQIRSVLLAILLLAFSLTFGQGRMGNYPTARHGGNYMTNFYLPPAPSSTPWAPAWSPDGRWIAFGMSGSIWRIDPTTGEAQELTCNRRYHSSPTWSPDGRWIVYTADDCGRRVQLEVLDVQTGETGSLTNDKFVYADPVFSPDGGRIAYVSTKPSGYFNVYIREFQDGCWAGEEVAVTEDTSFGRARLYFGEWDMHLSPSWLGDGRELLLVSNRGIPLGSGNVLRLPATSKGIAQSRTLLAEQSLYRTQPDVSVDSKRFVYSSTRGSADQFHNLYVQPTQGGEPYKLTFFRHDAFHPRWSPDGEWIAYISNEKGLPQLTLLETYGGERREIKIVNRVWQRPVGILSVRIVDAATSQLMPARIHLIASDGKFYAPEDTYARVSGQGDPVFHTTGSFRLELPVGRTRVTVVRGFEFKPRTLEVQVASQEQLERTIRLERLVDMAAEGWYSGSTHVHMNYSGNLHNTLENLLMMSAAEDQDIVNNQVANKDNRVLDHQFFVKGGGAHPLSTRERILVVGQEYRPPFYGHVFMLGLNDHLISPFTTGYEGTAIESLYPSNTDMLRKAKAQGATVGYVHAFSGDDDPLEGNLGGAKGFVVDAALGTVDALEWSSSGRAGFYPLYAVWNNGFPVAAVGGEDSISDLHRSKLVGSVRTYVNLAGDPPSMQAWFAHLREGNAFVSTGPLLDLQVSGKTPGESLQLDETGEVMVQVRIRSIVVLDKVQLVRGGEVVAEIPLRPNSRQIEWKKTIPVEDSTWFHLRVCGEPEARFPLDTGFAQAFTNPIWVEVNSRPIRNRDSAEYCIRWVDKLRQMADQWPGWRSDWERENVFSQFEEARQIYLELRNESD